MPIYEFECLECELEYEEIASFDKSGKYKSVTCPKCGSKKKNKLVSMPGEAIFANPIGTDKHSNSHDYRFHHKLESTARKERAFAEKNSHVGSNPYKDDPTSGTKDIDSGKYFGEVK